jgi:hypothetical protein
MVGMTALLLLALATFASPSVLEMTAKLAERLKSNEFLQQIDTKGLRDKATDETEHSVM